MQLDPENEEHRKAAMQVYVAFHTGAHHFTAKLMHLIAKADGHNKLRIGLGYPHEIAAYEEWNTFVGDCTEFDFFEKYKIADLLFEYDQKRYWQRHQAEYAERVKE